MRDLNEQMNLSQNSRAKFKQRIAGGAVLLIVLAIFLPFIFHHSHPADPAAIEQTQTQAPPAQASVSNNTTATSAESAPSASVATPPAPAASAAPVAQQVAAPAPIPAPEQSMGSDQPGLTSQQSEAEQTQPSAPSADVQQTQVSVPAANVQQTQPAAPAAEATTAQPPAVSSAAATQSQPLTEQQIVPKKSVLPAPAKTKAAHPSAARVLPPPAKSVSRAGQGAWILQVGSFTQPEYARELTSKLRAQGLQAYSVRTNHLTRVYVGPLASQQQAQRIQRQVRAEFQMNSLITKKN